MSVGIRLLARNWQGARQQCADWLSGVEYGPAHFDAMMHPVPPGVAGDLYLTGFNWRRGILDDPI